MKTLKQILQLLVAIARKGKFRHTGVDFSAKRTTLLRGLDRFIPADRRVQNHVHPVKKWILKNPYLKGLVSNALFIKNARRFQPGHLSIPHLRLSYIRNPRAASTASGYMMLSELYPDLRKHILSAEEINFLIDANLKHQPEAGEKENIFLMIARNPFARIVSVYREFFEGRSPYFLYEDYLFGVLRKGMSFNEFVKMVGKIPDALKDQHLRPQHTLLRDYVSGQVDVRILKLEDPDAIGNFLSRYKLSLEPINRSEGFDYRLYYDPETLARVYELYLRDIIFFGYNDVYNELKAQVSKQASPAAD